MNRAIIYRQNDDFLVHFVNGEDFPIHKDFLPWAKKNINQSVGVKIIDVWVGGRMNHSTMHYETLTQKMAVPYITPDADVEAYGKMPKIDFTMTTSNFNAAVDWGAIKTKFGTECTIVASGGKKTGMLIVNPALSPADVIEWLEKAVNEQMYIYGNTDSANL